MMTGKCAEMTKLNFPCPIFRIAIGKASCLICMHRRQLTLTLLLNQPAIYPAT